MRQLGALLAACALAAAGCGSDDDEDSGGGESAKPAPPPSKAEYIRTADSECRKTQRQALKIVQRERALFAKTAGADEATLRSTFKQIATLGDKRIAVREDLSQTLEGMEPPRDGGPKRYLAARRKSTAILRAHTKNLRAYARTLSEAATVRVNRSGERANASAQKELKAARAYGLKFCGKTFKRQ